ncbi:hypothetical protein [Vibrio quintilis]|uniref:Uncharacterized protein n=1 Tax=Vibrio quintilis TaxID=1117707 RepID=A0A1M7YV52_9VIBR|nr:hypothetical protein [Vibrio quintilis]SHO56557.1 hypothetical protein VQ7734_02326 [Vibrio quintilis]
MKLVENLKLWKLAGGRLKRAYVDALYSEHYEITVEELAYLAQEVEKLKALTEAVCLVRIGE